MQTHSMAARLSKFKVGDLALRSALELERARAGLPHDRSRLTALAEALRVSAGEQDEATEVSYMRPGYLEPFERVYLSSHSNEPKTSDEIVRYVAKVIGDIDAAARNEQIPEALASKLVDFCIELNREFVRRQPTETRGGRKQRGVPVEALVS